MRVLAIMWGLRFGISNIILFVCLLEAFLGGLDSSGTNQVRNQSQERGVASSADSRRMRPIFSKFLLLYQERAPFYLRGARERARWT